MSRELGALRALVNPYNDIKGKHDAVKELSEIVEADDDETLQSLLDEIGAVEKDIDKLEFKCILGEESDRCDAIVSINAGAGGTESCDWTAMMIRMYLQWAWSHGYASEMIDQLPGEEAGIKNTTFLIRGSYAYGYLKSERGVHRLVRISPFDSNKRRHTSFASVDVIPDIAKDIKVDIAEGDLRIDTYRSGGAGGQHVNVTDSAVRITHIPTGIVAQCQNERSQHKNKATAMKVLKSRLYKFKQEEANEEATKGQSEKKKIEWGSQIRSYVLHPYKMVKDHRTNHQTSDAEKVLDGGLNPFLESYLKETASKNKKKA